MLALARHFGNLDLGAARNAGEDLVFFTAPLSDWSPTPSGSPGRWRSRRSSCSPR